MSFSHLAKLISEFNWVIGQHNKCAMLRSKITIVGTLHLVLALSLVSCVPLGKIVSFPKLQFLRRGN